MITLENVTKVFPGTPEIVALDDISLDIAAGEIHGIVGESGAGKSTLIRCLTALDHPTSGHIRVDGVDLAALNPTELREARRKIGVVFQGGHLLDSRTARGNIAYAMQIAGTPRNEANERAENLLELVGLPGRGDAYPSQLSGGQRQRVAIARALATEPPVLLCDEPTSALDQRTTHAILELLAEINEKTGVTVLIITHEMGVVRAICTNVTLLAHGKVVQSAPVTEAVADVSSPLGKGLVPPPNVDTADVDPARTLLDIAFSARPGQPAATEILSLLAEYDSDITAGNFETVGSAQAARLVVSVPRTRAQEALAVLHARGVDASERSAA